MLSSAQFLGSFLSGDGECSPYEVKLKLFALTEFREENIRPFPGGWRRRGVMVSALVPASSGPGSSPGRGHCAEFLGKTLYSHSASLHPGV